MQFNAPTWLWFVLAVIAVLVLLLLLGYHVRIQ